MAKKVKKAALKQKKKKWFSVHAPKMFMEQSLGEIPAVEITDLKGKKLTTNLMSITNEPKKQGMAVTFEVYDVSGDKAFTNIVKYQILPSSIKRMVRRGKDRIDEVLILKTKDNAKVEVKPILLTRKNTTTAVHSGLRKTIKEEVTRFASKMNYIEFLEGIIRHSVQKKVYEKLKKIYPISIFEIRMLKLLTEGDKVVVKESKDEKSENSPKVEKKEVAKEENPKKASKKETAPKEEKAKENSEKVSKVEKKEVAKEENPKKVSKKETAPKEEKAKETSEKVSKVEKKEVAKEENPKKASKKETAPKEEKAKETSKETKSDSKE